MSSCTSYLLVFWETGVAGAEGVGEDGGLGVGDVGVVVAVDEEDGRGPVGDVGERGAGEGLGGDGVIFGRMLPRSQSEALSSRFQSWTPWKSTPAAKRLELRLSARAVR